MNSDRERLLVVDDNEWNRNLLSQALERKGYSVSAIASGEGALNAVAGEHFDLVLLDIMMPGMNGMEVLQSIRQRHGITELPVIMVTAKSDGEDLAAALNFGASDYVIKPLDMTVVLARLETQLALKKAVDRITRLERDLVLRNKELEAANERMRRDLRAAAQIQHSLLPPVSPDIAGADFRWVFRPCIELGGDILNVFRLDQDHVGLYLLDVAGHGVAAALLSVSVSRFLSHMSDPASGLRSRLVKPSVANGVVAPAEVAKQLNRHFPLDPATGQFFTLNYGVLALDTGEFRFACAGHPRPVYLPRSGDPRVVAEGEIQGPAIGTVDDFEYTETRVTLDRGGRVYLYSDGILEALNLQGEPFGTQRLLASVHDTGSRPLEESLSELVTRLERWTGATFADDVSLLAVELTDTSARSACHIGAS